MKTRIQLLIALFFSAIILPSLSIGQEGMLHSDVKLSNLSESRLQALSEYVDLTCGATVKPTDREGFYDLTLLLSEKEINTVTTAGYAVEVLIADKGKFAATRNRALMAEAESDMVERKARPVVLRQENEVVTNIGQYSGLTEIDWTTPSNFGWGAGNASLGSMGGFPTLAEIYSELDDMVSLYPSIVSPKTSFGTTQAGNDQDNNMYYVKISDNPTTDESATEPQTLYTSLYHAREGVTSMMNLYFMWYLLENYATDPSIQNLVDNHELYFILVMNPDGYDYNEDRYNATGNFEFHRKNRRNHGGCSGVNEGIDLNRNHGYNHNNGGSSNDPCSTLYHGGSPFTESETIAMRNLVLSNDFKLILHHHSFADDYRHAYAGVRQSGGYIETQTGFEDEYFTYSQGFTKYNRYNHGPSTQIGSYNSGNANDWAISTNTDPYYYNPSESKPNRSLAWTPENGTSDEGGFWPSTTNILPIIERGIRTQFMTAYYSGKYAILHDVTPDILTTNTGNITYSVERQGMTDGDFTVTIQSDSPGLVFSNPSQTVSGLSNLSFQDVDFAYTIGAAAPDNSKIKYTVTLSNGDYVLHQASYSKIFNTSGANVLYADNFDSGTGNWTMSGGGGWFSTTDGFSGNGMTNNTTRSTYVRATYNQIIDLSSVDSAAVQFRIKYDLERWYDYVQFEARSGSGAWTPLKGKYTKAGSTSQTQATGEQIWGGDTFDNWLLEEIPLNDYLGGINANAGAADIEVRFVYVNVGPDDDALYNGTYEGATIDDFQVVSLDESQFLNLPVEFTYFTAEAENNSIVNLNWATASEENNEGFEVQTSVDGRVWNVIGFVDGAGTTDEEQEYSFVHSTPSAGLNYYRLRQVDFDGESEFSNIEVVEIFTDEVKVTVVDGDRAIIGLPEMVSFRYNLVSSVGEILQTGERENAIGSVEVDLSDVANGMYYLQIIPEDGRGVEAFPVRKVK